MDIETVNRANELIASINFMTKAVNSLRHDKTITISGKNPIKNVIIDIFNIKISEFQTELNNM